jgi:hypothetical protein
VAETPKEAFERGAAAGEIAARLAGHDEHFAKINGSIGDMATELHAVALAVQRLGDQAISRDATVVTTAAALKDAEEARRDKTEQRWSPLTRLSVVVGTIAAAGGLLLTIYLALHK